MAKLSSTQIYGNLYVDNNMTVIGNITGTISNSINSENATNAVNADKLDNLHATSFLRTDVDSSLSGGKTLQVLHGTKVVRTSGGGISGGVDGANSTDANIRIHSWYGIGFAPSISGQTVPQGENATWINVRNGNVYTRGEFYAQSDGIVYHTKNIGKTINGTFMTEFRTQTKGDVNNGNFINTVRCDTADIANAPRHGSGIAWGRADTHGYLYMNYSSPEAYIGGGNANKLNWVKKISFSDHNHDSTYLKLTGGTMSGAIEFTGHNGITVNSKRMLWHHNNQNVTLSAGGSSGDLYIGYNSGNDYQTRTVRLEAPMSWKGSTTIVDANGKISWNILKDIPNNFAPSTHNHDDKYAKKSIVKGSTIAHTGPIYVASDLGSLATGILKIILPKTWSNTMLSFDLICYDYSSKGKTTYHISGYNYAPDSAWYNTQVSFEGNPVSKKVRFGHDGAKCCILIGETNSEWRYPKFIISNIIVGHSSTDSWDVNWDIKVITAETGINKIVSPTDTTNKSHTHTVSELGIATLTRGNYLTGSNYNGSTVTTWAVDATPSNIANKVVARDGSGNISVNQINTNIVKLTNTDSSDSASISTTINGNGTYFDFNLADDNNNDWWRWRFTPSGSTVYDAMILKPVANGKADLTVSGKIIASEGNVSGNMSLPNITGRGAHKLLYTDGSGKVQEIGLGSAGQILKSNGNAAPSWVNYHDYSVTQIEKTLVLTTSWLDTGIRGNNLPRGSYLVQITFTSDNQADNGIWGEIFTGLMSWYDGGTNSSNTDEIMLHKAGHAPNNGHLYLRVKRNPSGSNLSLQVAFTKTLTKECTLRFKFKRLI